VESGVPNDIPVRSFGPLVWVDGATAHYLESILEVGLRQSYARNSPVPDQVRMFAKHVSEVAWEYRMSVEHSSGASGANATSSMHVRPARRMMDTQEVADLAHISRNGVAEAARRGRLVATRGGGRWEFDPTDVETWLAIRAQGAQCLSRPSP